MDASSSNTNSSDSVESSNDDLAFDWSASRPCELAVKLPLWDFSFDLKALHIVHKVAEAVGNHERERQRLVLAVKLKYANPGALPLQVPARLLQCVCMNGNCNFLI